MDEDSGSGMGHTSTGGTTDGEVRSSMTNEGSNSNEVGAKDLKALGYDIEVDRSTGDSTDSGTPVVRYALYLTVCLVVLAILLSTL
ncbi:hypothetical protein HZS55_16655 [Halosimplex rubrum]|uniref:Uncharacterized protein n=1 Tax=Halosimplex rubrum TaxID=869889 RepID=A0A7D5PBX8_9EURY|nr:hypothetical protein [Halosimplex rubrum]QLH78819.1 hypothetical protein HZS55_16655 [Halosimplex rubrum]